MGFRPRPLDEQVIVVTGATSGIGLTTARRAARRGARVVLAARDERTLAEIVDGIEREGGRATAEPADVADLAAVRRIGERARDAFGRIDTWVNGAAVSIYGDLVEIDLEEHRRLFETNYWGYLHGCLVAVEHLRDAGGVIVNVGSVLSDRAIPKQGPYCASKHAVKALTDSLRMELEEAGLPIAVSLVKPAAIDTPYKDHARNYLDRAPQNPPPVYAPDAVARAILACAVKPRRDVLVGGGGLVPSIVGRLLPRLTDLVMERTMTALQTTDRPPQRPDRHNLYEPYADGAERGETDLPVFERSLYTRARLHPLATGLAVAALGAAAIALARR